MGERERRGAVVSKACRRKRRSQTDTLERWAERVESLVLMGFVEAGTPLVHPHFVRSQLAVLGSSELPTQRSLPFPQRTMTHRSEDASANFWLFLPFVGFCAIVSGRSGPPKRHIALPTRVLVELGKLF